MAKKRKTSKKVKKDPRSIFTPIILGIFLFILTVVAVRYGAPTGAVVLGQKEIINLEQTLDKKIGVFWIDKSENSMMKTTVETSKNSNIFVETDDCSRWDQGINDNDALYAVTNVKGEREFDIGNPGLNTMQQIELYKKGTFCVIIVNMEDDGVNEVRIKGAEADKDLWNIVE